MWNGQRDDFVESRGEVDAVVRRCYVVQLLRDTADTCSVTGYRNRDCHFVSSVEEVLRRIAAIFGGTVRVMDQQPILGSGGDPSLNQGRKVIRVVPRRVPRAAGIERQSRRE